MKRNRSTASPSSTPRPSNPSFPQITCCTSAKRLKRSDSNVSVITIPDSADERPKAKQARRKKSPDVKFTRLNGKTTTLSGCEIDKLLDPMFMQSYYQGFPLTTALLDDVQSKPTKQTSKRTPETINSRRSKKRVSSSESSESSESSAEEHHALSPSIPEVRSASSGSSTSVESADEFEVDVEELSEPEYEQDATTKQSSASKHDFSLADYDTLLSCCSKPRNRLRVQHKSRTLDNAAFFELLMSVRAIDLCISRMYIVNSEIPQAKHSLIDLQGRLFSQTGQLDLCQLIKSVLTDTEDHAKLRGREGEDANFYPDLVKYLVEIFVYMESLAFLRFRVFEMKLQELYDANEANLPAYLSMIFKLKKPMQQNQMDREPFKDLNLEQLNELKRVRNDVTNREYIRKHDLAVRLLSRQTTGSQETDTLVDQLQSVEHLNQLDPSGKVQVIKQLVDLIMFDGITYRAYINDLALKKVETAKDMNAENKKLKELEAKYQNHQPVGVDEEDEAKAQYLRNLEHYRKFIQIYQETKHQLECVVRSEPIYTVSASTDSDIRHLNMWAFDNLMPNYLIVESTKQEFTSGESKSSWFQINDVNEFTRSIKSMLPAPEFNQIKRSISKLNKGVQKPEVNSGLDATAPVSQDFLSRLTESQASRKPREAVDQTRDLCADREEVDDCQVSRSSQLTTDSLAHADRVIMSLLDLYERLLVSNMYRWTASKGRLQGGQVERYEIMFGEEFIKLTETWPTLVSKLERAISRADRSGLDPATKDRLLLVMSVMCQTLLDSIHHDTKVLPYTFFGKLHKSKNLGAVLHDYVLVNCRSFQFLGLFVTVLKNNIQWENSLENTECQICQETRIKDGSMADNTKIQCVYCNAYFHYGCLTYEEDESKITFFTYGKGPQCSICIKSSGQELMKNLEVESVDVSDYKLRAKRARGGYLMQERELDNEITKNCRIYSEKESNIRRRLRKTEKVKRDTESSSSSSAESADESWSSVITDSATPSASQSLRARKPVNYQAQLAEPEESDPDE